MSISREEVLKIAHISRLSLEEHEIEPIVKQLNEVLAYAQCVQELASELEWQPSNKNINIFRSDEIHSSTPETVLSCAPEKEEQYFVVPRIIDAK